MPEHAEGSPARGASIDLRLADMPADLNGTTMSLMTRSVEEPAALSEED